MNPKEYESNVLITESKDFPPILARIDDRMIRLLHAGLGLSSELAEVTDAASDPEDGEIDWINIAEEAGDLLWYTAIAVNTLDFDHNQISKFEPTAGDHDSIMKHSSLGLLAVLGALSYAIGNYNDFLKKHLFYGKPLNLEKMEQTLCQLCMAVAGLCYVSGFTIEEVRTVNIQKLKQRYGDKFSEAAALTRDLVTERKILEGEVT